MRDLTSLPVTADDIVDTVREPLLILDARLRVRRANRSYERIHPSARLAADLGAE